METKICSKCEKEQELLCFQKSGKYYSSWCKSCRYKITQDWRSKNRDKVLAAKKKYRDSNKVKTREYNKKHVEINRDRYRAYNYAWFLNNREKDLIRTRKYCELNKDKSTLRHKNYVKTLAAPYIKRVLKKNGFTSKMITPELIELKRLQLKGIRTIKQLENGKK